MCIYIDLYLHVKLKLYAHIKNTDIDVHINVPTQMYLHIHTDMNTYIAHFFTYTC